MNSSVLTTEAADFCALAEDAIKSGKPDEVPDDVLQRVFSAAVRLYTAKWEERQQELPRREIHDGGRSRHAGDLVSARWCPARNARSCGSSAASVPAKGS